MSMGKENIVLIKQNIIDDTLRFGIIDLHILSHRIMMGLIMSE